jgi:VCBS repeat-containing protein
MQFSASTTVPRFVTDLLSRLRLQANGDAYATGEDAGFTFTSADLLANDGGVTKSFVSLQATSAMGATISGQNGVFTYDAGARFDYLGEGETALDSFTYTIRDAKGETSTATVLVTVTGENDAVTLDDPLPMPARIIELPDGDRSEDTSVRDVSGSFAFGDADLSDAHVLSVTPRGGGYLGTFEAHLDGARAVAWDFSVLDRALAPLGAGETLTQSYDVTVSDGRGGTATKTISVDLVGTNDAPIASPLSRTVGENSAAATLLPIFEDADRNDTHFIEVGATAGLRGKVEVTADGRISYDAGDRFDFLAAGETATETFVYSVADNHGGVDKQLVTIRIAGENDAPVAQVLAASMKFDAGPLTLRPVFTDVDASDSHSLSVVHGMSRFGFDVLVNADGTFTYDTEGRLQGMPPGLTITDSFDYEVSDNHGGVDRNVATITIVNDNHNPVTQALTASVKFDAGPLTLKPSFTDVDGGDTLSISILSSRGAGVSERHVPVIVNPDGTFTYDPDGIFNNLPAGVTINDSFDYVVLDNHGGASRATATIAIVNDNHNPVAQRVEAAMKVHDGPLTVAPVFTDADPNDTHVVTIAPRSVLGIAVVMNPDGTFTYDTHGAFEYLRRGETTQDGFLYEVRDNRGGVSNNFVVVTITGDNHDPVAQALTASVIFDAGPLTLTPVFTDADPNDTHSLVVTDRSRFGVPVIVNPDGTLTYDPQHRFDQLPTGQTITDSFDYYVVDNHGGFARTTATISIINDNHNPVGQALTASMKFDAGPLTLRPVFTDVDASDTLSFFIESSRGASVSERGIPVIMNPDGTVTYDPQHRFDQLRPGETITDSFEYVVVDNRGGSAPTTAVVTIINDNHAPVAQALSATMRADGSVLTLRPVFTDADAGDTHTVSLGDNQFPNMALSQLGVPVVLNQDGTITYDPLGKFHLGAGQSTTDSFGYMVRDNRGGFDIKTATVKITGDQLPPTAPAVAVAETPGVVFDPTPHEVTGAIRSPGVIAGATASISTQTVRFLDANGTSWNAKPVQADGIKGSLHVATDIGGDGAFHWSFAIQDRNIDFLRAGDRAVLVTDVLIDDHHGSVDHALVTVTLLGAAEPPLPPSAFSAPDWWV